MADNPGGGSGPELDRTSPEAVDLGHRVPGIRPREVRLMVAGLEMEAHVVKHWEEQQLVPSGSRRGRRFRFEVVIDAPAEAGRLGVTLLPMPVGGSKIDP